MTFVIRSLSDSDALTPLVQKLIGESDPRLPVFGVQTQDAQVNRLLRRERLYAITATFFGAIAMILACIGVYGITSYSVSARTREIGVRMALGARRTEVALAVMRETTVLTAIGVIIGLGAVFGLTRFIASFLYGIFPTDPLIITGSALLMVLVAAAAGYIPARRAARVDPMIALRHE